MAPRTKPTRSRDWIIDVESGTRHQIYSLARQHRPSRPAALRLQCAASPEPHHSGSRKPPPRTKRSLLLKKAVSAVVNLKVLAIVSLFVNVVLLWPSFASTRDGAKDLALSEWQASKDFREYCIQVCRSNPQSQTLASFIPEMNVVRKSIKTDHWHLQKSDDQSPECQQARSRRLRPPPQFQLAAIRPSETSGAHIKQSSIPIPPLVLSIKNNTCADGVTLNRGGPLPTSSGTRGQLQSEFLRAPPVFPN